MLRRQLGKICLLLLAVTAGAVLLPRAAAAMEPDGTAVEACAEPVSTVASGAAGGACAPSAAEQEPQASTAIQRISTRPAASPGAVLLIFIALLSTASGVALGRADRRPAPPGI